MMLSQNLAALRDRAEKLRVDLSAAGSNPPPVPDTHGTFAQKTATLNGYLRTLESLRGGVIAPVLSPAPGTASPDPFPSNLRAPLPRPAPLVSAPSAKFQPDSFPSNLRAPLQRKPLSSTGTPAEPAKPGEPEKAAGAQRNLALLDAYDALVTDAERRAFARVHGHELRASGMDNSLVTHMLAAHELTGRCRRLVSAERATLEGSTTTIRR